MAESEAICAETPRGIRHPATVGLDPCKCHGLAYCDRHHAPPKNADEATQS